VGGWGCEFQLPTKCWLDLFSSIIYEKRLSERVPIFKRTNLGLEQIWGFFFFFFFFFCFFLWGGDDVGSGSGE